MSGSTLDKKTEQTVSLVEGRCKAPECGCVVPGALAALVRAGAADVVVVLAQRGAGQPHAVHVEPLVAAPVALHPVHLLTCGGNNILCLVLVVNLPG